MLSFRGNAVSFLAILFLFSLQIFPAPVQADLGEKGVDLAVAAMNSKQQTTEWRMIFHMYGGDKDQYYAMNVDGSDVMALDLPDMDSPSFSPDGTRVVFRMGEDRKDLYMMNIDGSGLTNLTNLPGYYHNYVWSPDGKRIAFLSSNGTSAVNDPFYSLEVASGKITRLSNTSSEDFAWSPDSNRIVYHVRGYPGYLKTVDASGSNTVDLTPIINTRIDQIWNGPIWSPDGKLIAFSGGKNTQESDKTAFGLYVMNIDGSNIRQVTFPKTPYYDVYYYQGLEWSADGKYLFYTHYETAVGTAKEFGLRKVDIEGLGEQVLYDNSNPIYFSVSPDGKYITFGLKGEIYVIKEDGSDLVNLTSLINLTGKGGYEGIDAWIPGQSYHLPEAPVITEPLSKDGQVSLRGFTGKIGGTASANATVYVYRRVGDLRVSGEPIGGDEDEIGHVTTDANGNWMLDDVKLVSGVNTFMAQVDVQGVKSMPSNLIQIIFETNNQDGILYASAYGINYEGWDTRSSAEFASEKLRDAGFTSSSYANEAMMRRKALLRLYQDRIFYFIGHGAYNAVGLVSEDGKIDALLGSDIKGRQFPNLQLVVLNGCSMGEIPDAPDSVTKTFLEAGAKTVVAYTNFTKINFAPIWGKAFWKYATEQDPYAPKCPKTGMSMADAANLAAEDAYEQWWAPRWEGGICDRKNPDCYFSGVPVAFGDADFRINLDNGNSGEGGEPCLDTTR